MSSTDEEETGYTMVLSLQCDEAKPRKYVHKTYDRLNMEERFYKTCKECRDKVKSNKRVKKGTEETNTTYGNT